MTHSTNYIYGYMASDIIMVKDHSDSERGNPLLPIDRIVHTTAFVTPVVEKLAGTRNSSNSP